MKRINKWVLSSLALALALGASSCRKDVLDLSDAGKDIYMTITPADPNLNLYLGDTIDMACAVSVPDGRSVNAEIKWTSDDESIAKFIDGTNRLVAVKGGEGKTVRIKASLSNGKYATTTASILKYRPNGLEFLSNATTTIGDQLYLGRDASYDFMIKATPARVLSQDEITFEGVSSDLFSVEKITLDPTVDKERIETTPEGAVWYRIKAKGQNGSAKLVAKIVTITGQAAGRNITSEASKTVDLTFGSRLVSIGLNERMDEAEHSGVINLTSESTVTVYTDFSPFSDADVNDVLASVDWQLSGSGAILVGTSHQKTETGLILKATVRTGNTTGGFDVSCSIQDRKVRKSFEIVDVSKVPFTGLTFSPQSVSDLYVGEVQPLRIQVQPRSSQAYLQSEFELEMDDPTIASIQTNADGTYALKGLKAGSTELIVTVRGKEFTLPITTKASVRSLLIDNTSLSTLMAGDETSWTANVEMEGTDQPTWSSLAWTSANKDIASVVAPATGQTARIKAGTTAGETTITATYRGKTAQRSIKIVPLQSSINWVSSDTDLDESVATTDNGQISIQLVPKSGSSKPAITLLIRPKNGAVSLKAGTYSLSNSDLSVKWESLSLVKMASGSSSITLTANGSDFNVEGQLQLLVNGQTITVQVSVQSLEKE